MNDIYEDDPPFNETVNASNYLPSILQSAENERRIERNEQARERYVPGIIKSLRAGTHPITNVYKKARLLCHTKTP